MLASTFHIPQYYQPQTEETSLHTSILTNVQVRNRRKKRVKVFRPLPKPLFNNMWESPYTVTHESRGLERRRRSHGLRPQYRDILIVKDFKFGLTGDRMRLKAKHAYKFCTTVPPVAVLYSEEAYQKYIVDGVVKNEFNGNVEEFRENLRLKKEQFRQRWLLERVTVKFQRRISGPGKEFTIAITKKDLANRIWNMVKVPLKEEQIEMPGHFPDRPIQKPGYYRCWVTLPDNPEKVKLRIYLAGGGKILQGY
jgi:hypothetical protein